MPSFRPPCITRSTLPPPRRVGLRFPPPVGHGRGLASRPGCAGPGEGIDSARRRLHRFRRGGSPRPSRFRLRLLSSMPGERRKTIVFCPLFGVNRPGFIPRRSGSRRCYSQIQTKCKEKQPPPQIPGSGRCRSTFQAVFSVERPLAWSVKKIIAVAPAALAVRPGSSFSRRQPARLRPAPIRITPRRSLFPKTAARSRHRA